MILKFLLLFGLWQSQAQIRSTQAFSPLRARALITPSNSKRVSTMATRERIQEVTKKNLDLPMESVISAVEKKGGRLTASDAASVSGIKISDATRELNKMAAYTGGNLEVSAQGDIVYDLGSDVRNVLRSKSFGLKARESFKSVWPILFQLSKLAFGVGIFASIAIVYASIIFISTSSRSSDDDRRDRRGYNEGGGFSTGPFVNVYYGNPFDIFWYRPYGYYAPYGQPESMGLLESIFSYVFGDGDPNYNRDETALKVAAKIIRQSKGVVTAEQLAPVLSPDKAPGSPDSESFMFDVLVALNGNPEVTEDGSIVYVFPDLQVSADGPQNPLRNLLRRDEFASSRVYPEEMIPFSLASGTNKFIAGILGVVNLVGALYLGVLLRDPYLAYKTGPAFAVGVTKAFPLLLLYAIGYNLIPFVRNRVNEGKNQKAEERNFFRTLWARELDKPDVQRKIVQARSYRPNSRVVNRDSVEYSTARDIEEQGLSPDQAELDAFDKLLKDKK